MTTQKNMPANGRKMKPSHPGDILSELVLPDIALSVSEIARLLGISRHSLRRILNAERPVTPEMAVRLSAFFNTSTDLWINLQSAYDVWQAQKALRKEIPRISAAGKELVGKTDTEYRQAA